MTIFESSKKPQCDIGCIIVHVGTNDAATSRVDQLVDIVAGHIQKLFGTLKILYPHSQMMFSSILPRFDDDDARGKEINQVSFIFDLSILWIFNINIDKCQ